jgi:hypothetical protein
MVQTNLQDLFEKNIGNNIQGTIASVFALSGISDVSLLTAKRGTGTFSLFVDSVAPVVSLSLIQQVQELVDSIKALGVTGYVEYPIYKSIRICFDVIPVTGKDATELLASLEGATKQSIVNVINNTGRGANLSIDALTRLVMDNNDVLKAGIRYFKVGEYSVLTDKVINEETKAPGVQSAEWNEKWFSSTNLVVFCSVGDE